VGWKSTRTTRPLFLRKGFCVAFFDSWCTITACAAVTAAMNCYGRQDLAGLQVTALPSVGQATLMQRSVQARPMAERRPRRGMCGWQMVCGGLPSHSCRKWSSTARVHCRIIGDRSRNAAKDRHCGCETPLRNLTVKTPCGCQAKHTCVLPAGATVAK